jgi:hypothetical protein
MHNRSYLFLCTLSVFLFLAGLVIFFFTIHKIVGIVVLVVLIAAGLFGMVYLVSTALDPIVLHYPTLGDRDGVAGRRGDT